jgi:hypothetical protein
MSLQRRTVFEAAGGNDGLHRFAPAWHRRVGDHDNNVRYHHSADDVRDDLIIPRWSQEHCRGKTPRQSWITPELIALRAGNSIFAIDIRATRAEAATSLQ